jgi:hypothetical protein
VAWRWCSSTTLGKYCSFALYVEVWCHLWCMLLCDSCQVAAVLDCRGNVAFGVSFLYGCSDLRHYEVTAAMPCTL